MKKKIFIFVTVFIILHSSFFILNCQCQWDTLKGFIGGSFHALVKVDSTIFSGAGYNLLKSTNEGITWQYAGISDLVNTIEYFDNRIFVGSIGGIFISSNMGLNWIKTLDYNSSGCFVKLGSYIFAGSSTGLFVSTNSGSNWQQSSLQYPVTSITTLNNCIFATDYYYGLFKSTNWGLNWSLINYTNFNYRYPYLLYSYGSNIFAFVEINNSTTEIYKSTNLGVNWSQFADKPCLPVVIKQVKNLFFISTRNTGVFVTQGLDLEWTQTSLYYTRAYNSGRPNMATKDTVIYVGSIDGIYYSNDLGTNWTNVGVDTKFCFQGIACQNDTVLGYSVYPHIIFRSTDNGYNWTKLRHLDQQPDSPDIVIYDRIIYLFGSRGISISFNGGANWIQTTDNEVSCLYKNGNKVYHGSRYPNNGLYLSTNSGLNWSLLWNHNYITSVLAYDSTIVVTDWPSGIFLSSNSGSTWQQTHTLNGSWTLMKKDSTIFCGHNNGILKSTNGGLNWINSGLDSVPVYHLKFKYNNIFAGTKYGVLMSSNNGVNWVLKNHNLGTASINAMDLNDNYIFVAPDKIYIYNIWRRLISDIVSIKLVKNETPKSFLLEQNYPNPFNAITNIKFDIPKSTFVKLKIYDLLGRELTTLVNENLAPATYSIDWNASDYPSGIYFYRMETEYFTETKKLILLK